MTLTRELVRMIRTKPVADGDRRRAASFVLDVFANAIAGRATAPGRILSRWAQAASRDAGREAFLMGGLTHILETDDLHRASVVHPGCAVVPAAYALARRCGTRGRGFLDAVVRGYEACTRVGMAVGPAHYRIWHNTATCGPFGSAMAGAELLDLDEDQCVHALGNAGTQASGLWQFLATGAMSKHLHAGRAAESGLLAAELAALGFTGPPAILEGEKGFFAAACPDPDPGAVLTEAAGPWQIALTSIKPWPSCRHTHPAIDAALEIHGRLGGAGAASVASVDVATYRAALDVCDRPAPGSEYAAKFSLQHCVAVALTEGRVGFGSFDDDARGRVAALAARTRLDAVEPFASSYPAAWGGRVRVATQDGMSLEAARRHCKGDPENAMTDGEMIAKATDLLAFGRLDGASARALIDATLALAQDGPLPALEVGAETANPNADREPPRRARTGRAAP